MSNLGKCQDTDDVCEKLDKIISILTKLLGKIDELIVAVKFRNSNNANP